MKKAAWLFSKRLIFSKLYCANGCIQPLTQMRRKPHKHWDFEACFRKPNEGEKVKVMNCTQMLELISKEYPSLKKTVSTKVHLGLAMKDLGFEHTERGHVKYYTGVPVDAA